MTSISPLAPSFESGPPASSCSADGLRTATAQVETPRIITPSSTAWPPIGASLRGLPRRTRGARRWWTGKRSLQLIVSARSALTPRGRSAPAQVLAGELVRVVLLPGLGDQRRRDRPARRPSSRIPGARTVTVFDALRVDHRARSRCRPRPRPPTGAPARPRRTPGPRSSPSGSSGRCPRTGVLRTPAIRTRRLGSAVWVGAGGGALARARDHLAVLVVPAVVHAHAVDASPSPGCAPPACSRRPRPRRASGATCRASAPAPAGSRHAGALEQREAHGHALAVLDAAHLAVEHRLVEGARAARDLDERGPGGRRVARPPAASAGRQAARREEREDGYRCEASGHAP